MSLFLNAQELFEKLVDTIDKPIEYSRLISGMLSDLVAQSAAQQIVLIDGVPYNLDTGRQKVLSLTRPVFQAAAHGANVSSRYLVTDGVPTAGPQGFYVPRDATITALWAKSRSNGPWSIEVRKNGANLTLASLAVIGSASANPQLNIDVSAGDWLQLFLVGTGVQHPIAALELAWRSSL